MISKTKLVTAGAAAALFAASAMPAFAHGSWHWSSDDLNINQTNNANIENRVLANSNTGNQALGGNARRANRTGNAVTQVDVLNMANSNDADVDSCGCFDDVTITQSNDANITNGVLANSNSGNQTLGSNSNRAIRTGNAYTGVVVTNMVNSNVAEVN